MTGDKKKFKLSYSTMANGTANFTFMSDRKELIGEDN